jgi:hypothetical protein
MEQEARRNVRFGSQAEYAVQNGMSALPPIATAKEDFRKKVMSALPLKPDMCGATRDFRKGAIADIGPSAWPTKRNHDFLKEKTSAPQSLCCAQGASI